jgi:plastocyanin
VSAIAHTPDEEEELSGSPPGIFGSSVVLIGPSYTYAVTFNTPGTYAYGCGVHGSALTGVIVVQ